MNNYAPTGLNFTRGNPTVSFAWCKDTAHMAILFIIKQMCISLHCFAQHYFPSH